MSEFKCSEASCENLHAGRPQITVITDENIKKVHDLMLEDRRVGIRQILEDTGLLNGTVHSIVSESL